MNSKSWKWKCILKIIRRSDLIQEYLLKYFYQVMMCLNTSGAENLLCIKIVHIDTQNYNLYQTNGYSP